MAVAASATRRFVAGGVGAALSHPADTLKTRLQGGLFPWGLAGAPARHVGKDNTVMQKLAQMRATNSLWPQLYAGFVPRLFRIGWPRRRRWPDLGQAPEAHQPSASGGVAAAQTPRCSDAHGDCSISMNLPRPQQRSLPAHQPNLPTGRAD
ncbi:unnamed protein product [Prorocentrum cordatum]|uniref:Uncharacterized protein n=1 Tax=Prorocentrum cordatum TaxID=2364126 RepID=A0ABN9YG46_9DINO|nr:unnamed protein product [Polarella glacialis]